MSLYISCPYCRAPSAINVTAQENDKDGILLLEYPHRCPLCEHLIVEEDVLDRSDEISGEIFGQMLDDIYDKQKERALNL